MIKMFLILTILLLTTQMYAKDKNISKTQIHKQINEKTQNKNQQKEDISNKEILKDEKQKNQ